MSSRFAALVLFALVACQSTRPVAAPTKADSAAKSLTLDDVFSLSTKLRAKSGLHVGWTSDGSHYLAVSGEGDKQHLVSVDVESGASTEFIDPAKLKAALVAAGMAETDAASASSQTSFQFDATKSAVLIDQKNDLWYWSIGSERAVRLTNDTVEEQGANFSPDGKSVGFVRNYNLFVVGVEGGEAKQLTTEGDEQHYVGRLDWVYQEEVYGRGNFDGFWWSPDSKSIAVLSLDERPVPEVTIPDHRRSPYPLEEHWHYPKSGAGNPIASLSWIDVQSGERHSIDLANYPEDDRLIVRVGWMPDSSSVVIQLQNRIQTWLDLLVAERSSGVTHRLFRDTTAVWIEPCDALKWLGGAQKFLWTSERDGYKHLYLYRANGELEKQLTSGPWEVDSLVDVDESGGWIYVSSDIDDVKGDELYRMKLDGSGMARCTEMGGVHSISMSPNHHVYLDTHSSIGSPGAIELRDVDGRAIRTLWKSDPTLLANARFRPPEFVKVKTRDGFEMEAMMIKPANFDPKKKYPVMCHTYSGPHAPQVRDAFGGFTVLFHEMLAQEGYLIWVCDNRSASGKGLTSVKDVYKNLGSEELRDLEDGLDWLVAQGYADPARIGMWGWSYGGYMTSFALTHSKRFKLGVAGAPVTDWRLYDSIYTERYMDLPKVNAAGYDASSVTKAAANLSGKLLVIAGTTDENVHMQNTLQFVDALQLAGKSFEMMLYPGSRHGPNGDKRKHVYGMIADFVRANL